MRRRSTSSRLRRGRHGHPDPVTRGHAHRDVPGVEGPPVPRRQHARHRGRHVVRGARRWHGRRREHRRVLPRPPARGRHRAGHRDDRDPLTRRDHAGTEGRLMTLLLMFLLDLVAIGVMTFGLYFPRHRRKDMVVAFLAVNLGLLAVTSALSADGIGIGIGFGLFAVLSIIRLRSAELDQQEVAYYFAALALGLLGGLSSSPVAGAGADGSRAGRPVHRRRALAVRPLPGPVDDPRQRVHGRAAARRAPRGAPGRPGAPDQGAPRRSRRGNDDRGGSVRAAARRRWAETSG